MLDYSPVKIDRDVRRRQLTLPNDDTSGLNRTPITEVIIMHNRAFN